MFSSDSCNNFSIQPTRRRIITCYINNSNNCNNNSNSNNCNNNSNSNNCNNKTNDNLVDNESNNISFHTKEQNYYKIRYSDDTPIPYIMFDKHFLCNFSVVDGDDIWSDTLDSVYSYNGTCSENVKDLWMISINISYKTYTESETLHVLGDVPLKLYVYIDGSKKFCRTYRNNRIRDDIILILSPGNCVGFQVKPGSTLSQDITK